MSVVANEKIFVEVGRSCLQDFLVSDKIGGILWMAQFNQTISDICSEGREGGRVQPVYSLELVLATAIQSIKQSGYVSRAKAQESDGELSPTSGDVMWMMRGDLKYNNIPPYEPTDAEYAEAKAVIEYIKTISTENDYKYNLHTIANVEQGYITHKCINYAVSMIPFYRRANELIIKKDTKKPSEFVGTVGNRETFVVTFLGSVGFDTQFGFMQIMRFEDANGNLLVWKTTTGYDIEQGTKVEITALVKSHEEYNGTKQTIINRPKFKEVK